MAEGSWAVFVSHSSKDLDMATALVVGLEDRGVRCWIAPRDVEAGREFSEQIVAGIAKATLLVVLFSHSANASKHVLREVAIAIESDKVVVPVRIDASRPDGALGYWLGTVHWVDAPETPIPDSVFERTISVLEAAEVRSRSAGATPRTILLNRCSRCGAQYGEHDPSGCSFHPAPPVVVGHAGPRRDYADIWHFPCCEQNYVNTFFSDAAGQHDVQPPTSPGCVSGRHVPQHHRA